jgi:pimeloyl-ACP methyl ester carboxylesterase
MTPADPDAAGRLGELTAQDGLKLAYRDYGSPHSGAVPVLCLPGLTRNSHDFDRLARHLARDRRVVAPDLRGRGRSARDPDWRNYVPAVYLNDLRHLVQSLNLHRFVVIGTSMGGLLGMALAATMPTLLAGLVMNDVGPEIGTAGAGRILEYIREDRPQPDWPAAIAEIKRVVPKLAPSMSDEADWRELAEGTYVPGADGRLHFNFDPALARPLLEPAEPTTDLWILFRALLPYPVLVVRGGDSDILSAETLARMASIHGDLRHVTLPGVGHAPTLNEPLSREAIDDFLRPF